MSFHPIAMMGDCRTKQTPGIYYPTTEHRRRQRCHRQRREGTLFLLTRSDRSPAHAKLQSADFLETLYQPLDTLQRPRIKDPLS